MIILEGYRRSVMDTNLTDGTRILLAEYRYMMQTDTVLIIQAIGKMASGSAQEE